jgi:hypothetical protein
MFNTKFRVVTDKYCGFECQVKRWWFPFWIQMGGSNTHATLDRAKNYIEKGIVVATYTKDT